ncbi:RING-H2 finger protein ATL38-like [Panicum miliaceum]|uniref:RING-type E3 ubiquitin transferase n=1 Tax=Panicum miliaceum TaxID=4540 RepID=A0A3L6RTQ2_PANMI|nr:RING-H2 finger protein ATL38-like [Panicum miliaceum]
MSAATAAVPATAAASVAAAESPGPHDNESVVLGISIFISIFFPIFIVLVACACIHLFRFPRDGDLPAPDASASASEWSRRGGSRRGGLDAAAIAALPLVFYSEVRRHRVVDGRDDALECSVCLLEFDDEDALRLLPTCPHAFHPECIALWLERHATCPLCRASVHDASPAPEQLELQPMPPPPLQSPEASPVHATVVVIGEAGSSEEGEEEEDWDTIQRLARNRRAAGRQALPRSNSTGHGSGASDGGMERFALRLPEHVRTEILMSHRLRHVTSAVTSVRVREGSAHEGSTMGGSVRNAVARLMSLFAPGAGWMGDGDDKSGKADATGASSVRRRENSSHGAVAEEKRSV